MRPTCQGSDMVTMKCLQHYSKVVGKSTVCKRQCIPLYDVSAHGKEVAGNVSLTHVSLTHVSQYSLDKYEKKMSLDC